MGVAPGIRVVAAMIRVIDAGTHAAHGSVMSAVPERPAHPERVCWGCDRHCRADDRACGIGGERTPHPLELFGDDWAQWREHCSGALVYPALGRDVVDFKRVYALRG